MANDPSNPRNLLPHLLDRCQRGVNHVSHQPQFDIGHRTLKCLTLRWITAQHAVNHDTA